MTAHWLSKFVFGSGYRSVSAAAHALRRRYLFLLSGCTLTVALTVLTYGWSIRQQQADTFIYQAQEQARIRHMLIEHQLEHVSAHLLRMHSTISNYFVYDALRAAPSQAALALRASASSASSPWDRLPPDLRNQIGSLHRLSESNFTDTIELDAVLAAMPEIVATHRRRPELQWSYYYDADKQWLAIYPPLSANELLQSTRTQAMDAALKVTFDAGGTAPIELARTGDGSAQMLRWTPPYQDAAGKGKMISVLAPVFGKTNYQGAVGADITLQRLSETLQSISTPLLHSMLLDANNQILVDSQEIGNQTNTQDSRHALLTAVTQLPATLVSAAAPAFVTVDQGRLLLAPFENTPLRLASLVRHDQLNRALWPVFFPYAAIAAALAALLMGFGWLLHRKIMQPALTLVCYIDALNARPESPLPDVPPFWTPWFIEAADTARERDSYRQRLLANSKELEMRVARRTEELEYANRALRVSLRQRGDKMATNPTLAPAGATTSPASSPTTPNKKTNTTVLESLDAPIERAINNADKIDALIQQASASAKNTGATNNDQAAKPQSAEIHQEIQTALQNIQHDLKTALTLNHNFGRLSLDYSDSPSRRFALKAMLDELLVILSYRFQPTPLAFTLDVPASIELIGHPHHVQQALDILLHAATVHCIDNSGAGNVDIHATSENDRIRLLLRLEKKTSIKAESNHKADMLAITANAVARLLNGACDISDEALALNVSISVAADMRSGRDVT